MQTHSQLKDIVREKYSSIATQDKQTNLSSCCGSGCCTQDTTTIMADDYSELAGYEPDADLGLGCGLPTQFAKIKEGDVVIDLGSGAGNDAFIARHETGASGKVIGIDFTPAMIERARKNAEVRKFDNVEFRQGDIEHMPVADNTADVIVSNCVLNLVPNKHGVIAEIFRVLKPGGHFSISDIVLEGALPAELKSAAEMYAGCVSGAVQKEVYLEMINAAGFINLTVQKSKPIIIPDDILAQYMTAEQIADFKKSGTGITSVTVYAEKPAKSAAACCGTDCCSNVVVSGAKESVRPEVIELLKANRLPTDDLPASLENFFTASDKNKVVGLIGLETYGSYGLLRSMVTDAAYRNKNIAGELVAKLEAAAAAKHLQAIYLLTETAEKYFLKKGYQVIQRSEVPGEIRQSSEFTHACPSSATVMVKKLV